MLTVVVFMIKILDQSELMSHCNSRIFFFFLNPSIKFKINSMTRTIYKQRTYFLPLPYKQYLWGRNTPILLIFISFVGNLFCEHNLRTLTSATLFHINVQCTPRITLCNALILSVIYRSKKTFVMLLNYFIQLKSKLK